MAGMLYESILLGLAPTRMKSEATTPSAQVTLGCNVVRETQKEEFDSSGMAQSLEVVGHPGREPDPGGFAE